MSWTVPVHQLVTHELCQRNEPAVKFALWVPSWATGWKKQWVCQCVIQLMRIIDDLETTVAVLNTDVPFEACLALHNSLRAEQCNQRT